MSREGKPEFSWIYVCDEVCVFYGYLFMQPEFMGLLIFGEFNMGKKSQLAIIQKEPSDCEMHANEKNCPKKKSAVRDSTCTNCFCFISFRRLSHKYFTLRHQMNQLNYLSQEISPEKVALKIIKL